jgi:hypothetical protein
MSHLKRILTALRGDGLDPKAIFTYKCPLCRHEIATAPSEVVTMTKLLSAGRFVVEDGRRAGIGEPGVFDAKCFEGLFLPDSPSAGFDGL